MSDGSQKVILSLLPAVMVESLANTKQAGSGAFVKNVRQAMLDDTRLAKFVMTDSSDGPYPDNGSDYTDYKNYIESPEFSALMSRAYGQLASAEKADVAPYVKEAGTQVRAFDGLPCKCSAPSSSVERQEDETATQYKARLQAKIDEAAAVNPQYKQIATAVTQAKNIDLPGENIAQRFLASLSMFVEGESELEVTPRFVSWLQNETKTHGVQVTNNTPAGERKSAVLDINVNGAHFKIVNSPRR